MSEPVSATDRDHAVRPARFSQADSEGSIPFTRSMFMQLDSLINRNLLDSRGLLPGLVGDLVGETSIDIGRI